MDVHKDAITVAVLPAGATAPTRLERLPNELPKLQRWLGRVARAGEVHACYEASGTGYVLHRALHDWGSACEVNCGAELIASFRQRITPDGNANRDTFTVLPVSRAQDQAIPPTRWDAVVRAYCHCRDIRCLPNEAVEKPSV